jgi:hypothetical protein
MLEGIPLGKSHKTSLCNMLKFNRFKFCIRNFTLTGFRFPFIWV